MKIIIAPAKRMRNDISWLQPETVPVYRKEAARLQKYMKELSLPALQRTLGCSERIAREAYALYQNMDLYEKGSPALLAYDGIQYTYMAPGVFEDVYFSYVQKHLRILSGFYGILRPLDEVVPYRLELQDALNVPYCRSLYAWWGDKMYRKLTENDHVILDLASAQYSRCITPYLQKKDHYVKCRFMEEENGKRVEKGVYVKMARGEMVRWLAEESIQDIQGVKAFVRRGYHFQEELSSEREYVFVRQEMERRRYERNDKQTAGRR